MRKCQRPSLPGHAIACWGFKTSIVMLPVATLKARATSNISFAMKSLLSQKAMFKGGTLKAPLQPRLSSDAKPQREH